MKRASDELVEHGGAVPPCRDSDVTEGIIAWGRLKTSSQQIWADWRLVGAALLVGRREAMRIACSNTPSGGRYGAAFSDWLRENGFPDLEKRTRADLLRIMERLAEVEAWLGGLRQDHRLQYNHPTTIWRKWSASKCGGTRRRPSQTEQQCKEEVRRPQGENDRRGAKVGRVSVSSIDRARLAKVLGMLGSNRDGEILNAAHTAEEMRRQANLSWEDLLGIA